MTVTIGITALMIHLFLCLLFVVLIKCHVMKISGQLIPLALFLPVWGFIMLLCADFLTRTGKNGTKTIQVDDLKLEEQDARSMILAEDDQLSSVVPLEEAMIVNDSQTRRQFMIDIIGEDAGEYTDLLKKAKYNDDIEVIHYASAAIMEIQRSYELRIQKKESLVKQNPEDAEAWDSYIRTLKNYIDSGLVEDNFLFIQRRRYANALKTRMSLPEVEQDIYYEAADNLIEMKNISSAEAVLKAAEAKWPGDERNWMLRLKICHLFKDKKKRDELVSALARSRMYFSAQAREVIRFWNR